MRKFIQGHMEKSAALQGMKFRSGAGITYWFLCSLIAFLKLHLFGMWVHCHLL